MTATLTPDQLFTENQGLVGSILKRVKRNRNEMLLADDDLMQVGRIALWRASERFVGEFEDARKAFSTYAGRAVFRGMVNEVRHYQCDKRNETPVQESQGEDAFGKPIRLAGLIVAPPPVTRHPADYARGRVMNVYKRAIASIKGEKWREIAIRRHLEGQDWPTIAKAFGYKSPRSLATMFNAKWREAILRRRGAKVSTAHMVRLERSIP